jgi:glycine cleavage system H protein
MQDVYFLDWTVNAGDTVQQLQHIGHIETSKAVADLFAPLAGTIVEFNRALLKDPSAINVDKYGAGWLFEMTGDASVTRDVQEYHAYLAANWEKTQRLIKGKINVED